jgi:hypothetical protein
MLSMHPVTVISCCRIFAMQHTECSILQSYDGSVVAYCSLTMEALLPCCPVLRLKHCCSVVNAPCYSYQLLSHLCNAAYCMQHTAVLRWKRCCILQSYDGSTVAMLSSLTIKALLPCCQCTLSQLSAVVTSLQCSIL